MSRIGKLSDKDCLKEECTSVRSFLLCCSIRKSVSLSTLCLFKMGSLGEEVTNSYLYKHSHNPPYLKVDSASGLYINLGNGQGILDATGGAAVSAIGHGNTRVKNAIAAQLDEVEYCHPGFFKTACAEQLADFLVDSTSGKMARACILGSGPLPTAPFVSYC